MAYLAFDLGTTALKSGIIQETGNVLAITSQEYVYHMPAPGLVEMQPEVYWKVLKGSLNRVLKESGIDPGEIKAIGFSSQGQTFIPLDKEGQPLYPAIVWLDNRARNIVLEWQSEWLSPSNFQLISGYPWMPGELTIFKIAWLLQKLPELTRTWKFIFLPDYIIYRLTGEIATDYVTARMGGMYDFQTGRWEASLLKAAGISTDQLPAVVAPGTAVGLIQPVIATELGIPAGIPVFTGANDQIVSAIGAGNCFPGFITETTGTALAVLATIPRVVFDDHLTIGRHILPDLFYVMSFANTSAIILKWLKELCNCSQEDYEIFLEGVEKIPIGSEGLTVLPHFSGKTPPHGDADVRGAFLGLTLAHTRSHLARAIMEACACLLYECLQPITNYAHPIKSFRSLGGAARSDLWLQIKADMLGIPVERPFCTETAALGAAMLAATGFGQFSSLSEAIQSWYHPARVFDPDPALFSTYQELYSRYLHYSKLFYGS